MPTPFPLKPLPAWIAILALMGFSALCILVHAGGLLRLAFPLGCFGVGVFLYWRYPILYLGFTWWVWFLSPWLRRVVDLNSGWVDPSPLLLAPFLTTLVTLATFVRYLPKAYYQGGLPFLLAMLGVIYGALVGLVNSPPTALVVPLLNWLTPILFAFHLFIRWREYPSYRQNMQRTFIWSVLVMGGYGVWQYLTAPAWDRFWLQNQETLVFGTPEPLGIRVFSTMNSPQPFAFVLGAGLILLFSSEGMLRFFAAGAGYLSFLLSLARSAWLGWFASLLLLIPSLKPRLQIRLIVTLLVMGLLIIPLVTIPPFSEAINARVQSLTDVQNDQSYSDRAAGYNEVLGQALGQFLGQGLGTTFAPASLGGNDSGILTLLFYLGWLGTLPYLGALLLLLFRATQNTAAVRQDPFLSAARAIVLGALAQIGLNNVMLGVFGMVLWGFLGMVVAGQRYHWQERIRLSHLAPDPLFPHLRTEP